MEWSLVSSAFGVSEAVRTPLDHVRSTQTPLRRSASSMKLARSSIKVVRQLQINIHHLAATQVPQRLLSVGYPTR